MLEGLSSDILERPASLTADDIDGDVLAHFGIKGQKWGVRRYQNSDGSLTEEGKLRYRDSRQSSTNANLTKGQARFIEDAKVSLRKTPPDKDVDAYNQTLKDLGKAAEESGVMDPSDVLSPYHLSSSPDQSSMLSAIHDNMPTVKENNERYYKSEADKYKENADGFRKEKIDKLDETINEFYPDLHKELGTKPGKETRNYLIDAVKGFNEGDPDMVTYQHMNGADGLLYDGYLDEKTFNKLYDGQAAEDAVDNLHYGWNSDDIKQYNGWYKELHQSDDTSDFLAHHGIKGQKWGVRRYQNPDGTLTDAGKKHYSKGLAGAIKTKRENALLRNTMAKSLTKKESDKAVDEWLDDDKKAERASNKYGRLADAEDRAVSKAAAYSQSKNRDSKKEKELWGEAAKRGDEAERYHDEVVAKADSKRDSSYKKVKDLDQHLEALDNKRKKAANKYIKKYGQEEFDKIPKTDNEITERAVDDMIEVMSGNMTKKQYNKKYYGTGFILHSDFLAHHGIKGQKWGNRRYQNSDGSLTALGRVRYGVGAARNAAGKALRKATGRQTDAELRDELNKAINKHNRDMMKRDIDNLSGKRKKISKMTDSELDAYIDRMAREQEARAMAKELKNDSRNFISKFAHEAAKNAADQAVAGIGEGVKRGISNSLATKFDEAEKRKQAKKWDKYDEKHNADKVDAAKTRDKLNAARDKLELRALNGDVDAAAILNTVAKSSRGNADKHSNTSATKDAVENARNLLELQAINGDKEALKRLKKITDAKKGSKNGGNGKGGNGDQGSNGKKKPDDSADKPSGQNGKKQDTSQPASGTSQSTPDTSSKKSKKDKQQKSTINSQEAYQAARQKAKENLKKQASTPVSEARAYSVSNDAIDWMAELSSRKALPPAKK